ncbi:MAG TPA: MBL fold metallo-hydrolase [Spirochaetia bacterium]|nr:MBL fold metallo-hydrolase [Spirochaetales bacterium]HRS64291.1 MBL fold metallo-hydrolase [Spirochaetia bacterium]HOT58319.1 MBL fold metallo-hydrolase [Spirochaetales bacterium]HPD80076.1 MBL fold metallo-hydrolase [Spirochaetales bacterium]HQG39586.1 MBL fold metallo-hydrolase [Spirochaetales bacterium]
MKIQFWGTRGSLPTPLTNQDLQNKIAAIIQLIQADDIINQDAKQRFISRLPEQLVSSIGGNSACISIANGDTHIIFDAGTGIQQLGRTLIKNSVSKTLHIFFSHFHWDHIQGLPFFAPAFNKDFNITFYSPVPEFESYIRDQMRYPYFPITMDNMLAQLNFVVLSHGYIALPNMLIYARSMNHPGGCYSYRIQTENKVVIYSTDTELSQADFEKTKDNIQYFNNADMLIIDAQYTLGEALEKQYWGHTSYSLAIDFATTWNIKKLVLFHHEPTYSDKQIYKNYNSAKWYKDHIGNTQLELFLAKDGLVFEL